MTALNHRIWQINVKWDIDNQTWYRPKSRGGEIEVVKCGKVFPHRFLIADGVKIHTKAEKGGQTKLEYDELCWDEDNLKKQGEHIPTNLEK